MIEFNIESKEISFNRNKLTLKFELDLNDKVYTNPIQMSSNLKEISIYHVETIDIEVDKLKFHPNSLYEFVFHVFEQLVNRSLKSLKSREQA